MLEFNEETYRALFCLKTFESIVWSLFAGNFCNRLLFMRIILNTLCVLLELCNKVFRMIAIDTFCLNFCLGGGVRENAFDIVCYGDLPQMMSKVHAVITGTMSITIQLGHLRLATSLSRLMSMRACSLNTGTKSCRILK